MMMRRLLVLSVLLSAFAAVAHGQRYLAGMRGAQAMGGVIEGGSGYYLHGGYSQYTRGKNRWACAAEYLQRNYGWETGDIPLAQVTAEFSYYKLLVSDASKSFFAAVGVSALAGYEAVNWGEAKLPNGAVLSNGSGWLYGAAAAVELEYYLDDRYIFLLTAKQRAAGGSSVGMFHTQFGVGIKYILD
jgi:hypothetical protein